MVDKIRAAVDARGDSGLLVVARTDARAVDGFDAAIDRAHAFAAAGADVLFVEALEDLDEVRRVPALLPRPALLNIVVGGRTPVVAQAEACRMRYGCVLYANAALQGALRGMREALLHLQAEGRMDEDPTLVASFSERQALVGKPMFDALERRFGRD
jgi:2-methylisocitrate lyase-like PEP mutase family enzyme